MAKEFKTNVDVSGTVTVSGQLNIGSTINDAASSTGSEGDVLTVNSSGNAIWQEPAFPVMTHTFTLEDPVATDKIPIFRCPVALTISKVTGIVTGTTPVCKVRMYYGSNFSTTTSYVFNESTFNSTTTGNVVTTFDGTASLSAGDWVIFYVTAITGTVDMVHLTIEYTYD